MSDRNRSNADRGKRLRVRLLVFLTVIIFGSISGGMRGAWAQSGIIVDLGTGPHGLYPVSINDRGEVVGNVHDPGTGNMRAFLYSDGKRTLLGTLGGTFSRANDINNRGQIVGEFQAGTMTIPTPNGPPHFPKEMVVNVIHPFIYNNLVMSDLSKWGVSGGRNAVAINDQGDIIGHIGDNELESWPPYLYSNGTLTHLDWQGDNQMDEVIALNNLGQIIGVNRSGWDSQRQTYFYRGILYSGGAAIDIGTLGGQSTYVTALNNKGQIVGISQTPDNKMHAFLYSDGKMVDLHVLAGIEPIRFSVAEGINDSGQVVLNVLDSGRSIRAVLYSEGKFSDLGSLGGSEIHASDINNLGQVVGTGRPAGDTSYNGFLYYPPGFPSTPGDVNQNGSVDVADAVLILRVLVQMETLSPEQNQLADVVKDDRVDTSDAVKILRVVIGLDRAF